MAPRPIERQSIHGAAKSEKHLLTPPATPSKPASDSRFQTISSLLKDTHLLQRRTLRAIDSVFGTEQLPEDISYHQQIDDFRAALAADRNRPKTDQRRSPPFTNRRTLSFSSGGSSGRSIELDFNTEDPYQSSHLPVFELPSSAPPELDFSSEADIPFTFAEMDPAARKFIEETRPAGLSKTGRASPDFRTRNRPEITTSPRSNGSSSWLESISPLLTSEVEKLEKSYKSPQNYTANSRYSRPSAAYSEPPRRNVFGLDESDLSRVLDVTREEDEYGDRLTEPPVARQLFGQASRFVEPAVGRPRVLQGREPSGLDVTGIYDSMARIPSRQRPVSGREDRAVPSYESGRSGLPVPSTQRYSVHSAHSTRPSSPRLPAPSAPTEAEVFGTSGSRTEPRLRRSDSEYSETRFRDRMNNSSATPRIPDRPARMPISLPSEASKTEIDDAIRRLEELDEFIRGPRQRASEREERKIPEIAVSMPDDSGYAGGATPRASWTPGRTILSDSVSGSPRLGLPARSQGSYATPTPSSYRASTEATAGTSGTARTLSTRATGPTSVSVAPSASSVNPTSPDDADPLGTILDTARSLRNLVSSSTTLAKSAAGSASQEDGTADVLLALAKVGEAVEVGLSAIARAARTAGEKEGREMSTPSRSRTYEAPAASPMPMPTRKARGTSSDMEREERTRRDNLFRFRHHHAGEVCYGGRNCTWNNV